MKMTRKEKTEPMKHDTTGKKKTDTKHAGKEKIETADKDKEKLQEELKASSEKVNELQDKYLRLSAEFDNYRERTLKEKSEMIKTASEDLLKKIIPVVDDFERGLSVLDTAKHLDAVKQGMNLIYEEAIKHCPRRLECAVFRR